MKKEKLSQMVERRNYRLRKLFADNDLRIRLIGDPNKPAIILDEELVLSCYVKNFELHFTREPFSDEIVKTIKLKQQPEASPGELEDAINNCRHRPVFKIKLANDNLYLVGYNYLEPRNGEGRYPVFARHKPKVYFKKEYAEEIRVKLSAEGYKVLID